MKCAGEIPLYGRRGAITVEWKDAGKKAGHDEGSDDCGLRSLLLGAGRKRVGGQHTDTHIKEQIWRSQVPECTVPSCDCVRVYRVPALNVAMCSRQVRYVLTTVGWYSVSCS